MARLTFQERDELRPAPLWPHRRSNRLQLAHGHDFLLHIIRIQLLFQQLKRVRCSSAHRPRPAQPPRTSAERGMQSAGLGAAHRDIISRDALMTDAGPRDRHAKLVLVAAAAPAHAATGKKRFRIACGHAEKFYSGPPSSSTVQRTGRSPSVHSRASAAAKHPNTASSRTHARVLSPPGASGGRTSST